MDNIHTRSLVNEKSSIELSLVIPVYNEEEILPLLYERLCQMAQELQVEQEWIFVNDGSTDRTWAILFQLASKDHRVKGANFSRNFGHQIAITAGVDLARGKAVVIMDADLQDPPEIIPEMYRLYCQGYDVVYAKRRAREGESWLKLITAKWFYRVIKVLVPYKLPENVGDFRLISQSVVKAIQHFPEHHRFYRGLISWLGFKQTSISFDRPPRARGKTKYSWKKMIRFALDAILSLSYLPLRIPLIVGLFLTILSCAYGIYIGYCYFVLSDVSLEWRLLLELFLFLNGLTFLFLGIGGEYLARIYEEVKHRPLYIVTHTMNLEIQEKKLATGGVVLHSSENTLQEEEQ